MLDICCVAWYIIQARVGEYCARTAMMREIALKNGNFRGVCPVIGRLNCFKRLRISLVRWRMGRPRSAIFHGSE